MSATPGPMAPVAACGIDFGTSNSTAGWSRPGQRALLALEDGKLTLPSVIFFHAEDAHVSYGRAALDDYLEGHEGRMMRSLKSLPRTRAKTLPARPACATLPSSTSRLRPRLTMSRRSCARNWCWWWTLAVAHPTSP